MSEVMKQQPRGQFSSCCGKPFNQTMIWPRVCTECSNEFWDNPIPVAVILQPVIREDGKIGIIVIRRAIQPGLGQLALPGGFQEIEDWRDASARELNEECAIFTSTIGLKSFAPYPFESSTDQRRILFFCIAPPILEEDLPPFAKNREVSQRLVVYAPIECCFNTHTEAVRQFFQTYLRAPQRHPTTQSA